MTQQPIPQTVRLSSVALAVILLAVLAVLALRVHAEGPATTTSPVSAERDQAREVRKALLEQQKTGHVGLRAGFASTTHEGGVASSTKGIRASLEEHRAEVKKNLESQKTARATQKALLKEDVQARLKTRTDTVGEKMTNVVARAEKAVAVLTERIDALETKTGTSLTEARSVLEETKTLITKTKEDIALFNSAVEEALASATPKENMATVRSAGQVVREDVEVVHANLLHAIELVRAVYTNTSSASSTSTSL